MPQTVRSISITLKGGDGSLVLKNPTEKVVLNVSFDIDSTRPLSPLRSNNNSLPSHNTRKTN